MVNITFIIGNGFDLNLGLKTSYTDFYKIYVEDADEEKNELIQYFKKSIPVSSETKTKIENWSDFEKAMGEYSTDSIFTLPDGGDKFLSCAGHFLKEFESHLKEQVKEFKSKKLIDLNKSNFIKSILKFSDVFIYNTDKHKKFAKIINECTRLEGKINFLQLNYTDVFDIIYERCRQECNLYLKGNNDYKQKYGINQLGVNIHVHGEVGNLPVLGVSSIDQIISETVRNNPEVIKGFIKENYYEARKDKNKDMDIPADIAKILLWDSDIVCIYGASIGETDKHWWVEVGNLLKEENKLLIILGYKKGSANRNSNEVTVWHNEKEQKEKDLSEQFMNLAGWTDKDKAEHGHKIIVEAGDGLFGGLLLEPVPV